MSGEDDKQAADALARAEEELRTLRARLARAEAALRASEVRERDGQAEQTAEREVSRARIDALETESASTAARMANMASQRDDARARGEQLKSDFDEMEALYGELRSKDEENRRQREELLLRNQELQSLSAKAEAASKLKSGFLANMSHELRTPMNSIIGFTDLVLNSRRATIDDRTRRHLQVVRRNARHLLQLINSVLDLAKIESGRTSVFPEPLDLGQLIASVASTAAPLAHEKHLALQVEAAGELGTIVTDETKLRQILLNLVSNAIKFTPAGAVTLRASRTPHGFAIAVHDTGVGIAPADHALIFEEFFQLDASSTREAGGTGLGLAIARRTAGLLGGTITLESAPGRGSTFTLSLPRSAPQAAPLPPERAPVPFELPESDEQTRAVVVIDDDPDLLLLVSEKLRDTPYMVVPASSGESGLQLVRSLRPHAVVLDILMPRMDGWSVLRELKRDPTTAQVPVVVLSVIENQVVGFALGASAYLTKPVDADALVECLNRFASPVVYRAPVLVVDDNPDDRALACQLLAGSGARVVEAADGREALAAIGVERPALVMLDLTMPRMDGFELIARLRAESATRDVPIVVVTAKDLTREDAARLRDVSQVIPKGRLSEDFVVDNLKRLLDQALATATGGPTDA